MDPLIKSQLLYQLSYAPSPRKRGLGTSTNSPGRCADKSTPPRGDSSDIAAPSRTGKASGPFTIRAAAESKAADRNYYCAMSKPIVTRAVIVFSPRSIGAGDDAIFGLATPIGAIGSKSEPSVIQATRPRLTPEARA